MAKGRIIAQVDVTDPEEDARYAARTPDCVAKHGGRFLVRAGRFAALEGGARARRVVMEFPDDAAARAFYDDPAYRAIRPHARTGSTRELLVIEGVEP
mgnify:CR=1 FL=1